MKLVRTWILMVVTALSLSQCNTTNGEEDPTPDPGTSKTELLAGTSSRAWILTSSKIDGSEVINQSPACTRDDNMVYRTNKTYEWNEGATKCRVNDAQIYETGTWEFNQNETELILDKTLRYKLLVLNKTTLQISIKNVFGETEELTFKHN